METGRERLEQEQDFYRGVDNQARRSSCSCHSLAIFFIVMLAISSVVIVLLAGKMKDFRGSFSIKSFNFSKKNAKVGNVIIYESDLQSRINGTTGKLIPLGQKKIYIKEDGLYLEGYIGKEKLVFVGEPTVKDKKVVLENVRLQDQSIKGKLVPATIYSSIGKVLSAAINRNLGYNVSEIILKKGEMVLTVF